MVCSCSWQRSTPGACLQPTNLQAWPDRPTSTDDRPWHGAQMVLQEDGAHKLNGPPIRKRLQEARRATREMMPENGCLRCKTQWEKPTFCMLKCNWLDVFVTWLCFMRSWCVAARDSVAHQEPGCSRLIFQARHEPANLHRWSPVARGADDARRWRAELDGPPIRLWPQEARRARGWMKMCTIAGGTTKSAGRAWHWNQDEEPHLARLGWKSARLGWQKGGYKRDSHLVDEEPTWHCCTVCSFLFSHTILFDDYCVFDVPSPMYPVPKLPKIVTPTAVQW